MTFKEKLREDNPRYIDADSGGGCNGCPYDYSFETINESIKNCEIYDGKGCEYCWNREMKKTKNDNINHPNNYKRKHKCIDIIRKILIKLNKESD